MGGALYIESELVSDGRRIPHTMDAVKDRLLDVDLITSDWDIINWDDKQSSDATGAARKRRQRAKEKLSKEKELRIKNKEQNVTVTGQSRDSHGTEKNDQRLYCLQR